MTALHHARSQSSADDPLLPAYRILLRIAMEKKAADRAAVETPPDEPPPKGEAGAAPEAPASSSHPSTTARPQSRGGLRRA